VKREKGTTLLEVMVSLALLGIIGVLFLEGVMNSANARVLADEHASAKILAESIIDTVKKMDYSPSYTVTIPQDYAGYTADLTVAYLDSPDIQQLTLVISHGNRELLTLENYKVNR
jgi:prepilin-type N-terminal cleavage/methylation domain-containing protein